MGRPTDFTPELAAKILNRLRDGDSLRTICAEEDMPGRTTIWDWRESNEQFATQYARARQAGLEALADDLLHIADTPEEGVKTKETLFGIETTTGDMLDHRKLQVDTRKWYLSKLAPKIYGDKSTVDVNLKGDVVSRLQAGRKRAGG